jgi:hypothetical protein
MGIRKNAKFLSATEKLNYVKACVLMKADIVNPMAAAVDQYSRWDEFVAIHAKIQNAFSPAGTGINFGHGGAGAYGFLTWHRFFLYTFEQKLQTYVPGVMIPYWDWTDPATIMVAGFLGPNGDIATGNIVNQGYFAYNKPGSAATPAAGSVPAMPANATALPAWWPPSLPGWRLPAMFPSTFVGGLKRSFRTLAALPTPTDIRNCLALPDYAAFQAGLEGGAGIPSGNIMHNAMHPWVGNAVGHMTDAKISSFDPIFWVLHCNVDRLWAMWQEDGHSTEFPVGGADTGHNLVDMMYPWVGATPGFGTSSPVATVIPMPTFAFSKTNGDTLEYRNNFNYAYDTIPIIGLGLDRTGSMAGLTPDPMDVAMPDVSKWEAAKRGISAFLQDCETVRTSGLIYVIAGIKTFRRLVANDFVNIFGAPGFGLVKTGTSFSKATFDGATGALTPGGGTPLADALNNVQTTLVAAPFTSHPADERRYMAFLTDGLLTAGAPMSSIPNGSFTHTAIFAMGFGTGADVDYPTLASMVAKGITLATPQVFHGENAGTIDKFYSNALAGAIGFTTIFDPLIELFAGEHAHLDFFATSADDAFLITAQGMDFQDNNWMFMLHGPNDEMLYGDDTGHQHSHEGCHHCCPGPDITARRSNGRLSLMIQRGTASTDCWVGKWELMIAYKTNRLDAMMMPDLGESMFPVSAGPIRGARYARLLLPPTRRIATRRITAPGAHGLDTTAVSTNKNDNESCSMLVNVYGRTNLKLNLHAENIMTKIGEELKLSVVADINGGSIKIHRAFVRFTAPSFDISDILPMDRVMEIIKQMESSRRNNKKLDVALILAQFEKEKNLCFIKDHEGKIVSHDGGPLHLHTHDTTIPGTYHFGVYIEGAYYSGVASTGDAHDHGAHDHAQRSSAPEPPGNPDVDAAETADAEHCEECETAAGEQFTRLLNISVAVVKDIPA